MLKKLVVRLVFFLFLVTSYSCLADEPSARQLVEDFQNELITVMKQGKELGFKGRYEKLDVAVKKSHDMPKLARIVVGKQWEELSPEQQSTLEKVFSQLSISAYAHNFKDYTGESFNFISEEETGRGGVVIHTNLHIPNEKDVKFDYMLKKKDDGWRIINIIADGVSDLALKRSEYTSVLSKEGFNALISKITDKINNYAAQ
jgi:phospholipid transport system substrate-binding protein